MPRPSGLGRIALLPTGALTATLSVAIVRGVSGLVIPFLPLALALRGDPPAADALIRLAGALIGFAA